MSNIISDETIEYVGILAKLELSEEEKETAIRNYLKLAHLSLGGGNVLLIVLEDAVAVAYLNEEERLAEINDAIEKNIGKQVEIRIIANETGQPFGEAYADLEQLIQMDIVVEEDSEGGF